MRKRTGDLWWVSTQGIVGPLVVAIFIVVLALIGFFAGTGRYLEAVLAATAGVFFLCLAVLDVLGEILGNLRDLNGVLGGRKKEESGQPA